MSQRRDLLNYVAGSEQDFEWYPTTNEIIEDLHKDLVENSKSSYPVGSFLDIGAGDGKVITTLKKYAKTKSESQRFSMREAYAIEKSTPLLSALPNEIFIIGTDFFESSLVDKEVDVVFSNPPYSIFEKWTEKIIKEANSKFIYLVIPERWSENKIIKNALEYRNAKTEIVGSYSFEKSEDRKARANVNLIRIKLSSDRKNNPFDKWFNEYYGFEKADFSHLDKKETLEEKINNSELVSGASIIERLEELYIQEMNKLNKNYESLSQLDPSLLSEMDVNVDKLIESFKYKIKGVKNLYWSELFDNLEKITSRLTKKSRQELLATLTSNTNIDFTVSNAYAVVIWAIKNANKYYDEQLLGVYKSLTTLDSIRTYKSNERIVIDDWRYLNEELSHYALDYRIIKENRYAIVSKDMYYADCGDNNLANSANDFIMDIITIGSNLGFNIVDSNPYKREWISGKAQNFYMTRDESIPRKKGAKTNLGKIQEVFELDKGSIQGSYQYKINNEYYHQNAVKTEEDLFMETKAFKNGNLWFKFNKKFMKALNLEAARLNGWVKSPKEASEEFDITEEEATELFKSNFVLIPNQMKNLLT